MTGKSVMGAEEFVTALVTIARYRRSFPDNIGDIKIYEPMFVSTDFVIVTESADEIEYVNDQELHARLMEIVRKRIDSAVRTATTETTEKGE